MSFQSIVRLAVVLAVTCLTTPTASAQITIPTVTIGNPGNAADPSTASLYGSVEYTYNIGQTEVTNAQYVVFLNAKARSDPYGLYHTAMAVSPGGISRAGSDGAFVYATIGGRENNPVAYVSFWDACRFANWLHNGQGDADTESGAYTLTENGISNNSVQRNSGWKWAIASEDEWYKAAYFQPSAEGGDSDGYWTYPTSSNASPTFSQANFAFDTIVGPKPVGTYVGNYCRSFDLAGNVKEWNDSIVASVRRGLRGGSFSDPPLLAASFARASASPVIESGTTGFRVSMRFSRCLADFDRSGFVDSDDFSLFVFAFAQGCVAPQDPVPECVDSADCDSSGFVDVDDFVAFVEDFVRGC